MEVKFVESMLIFVQKQPDLAIAYCAYPSIFEWG